MNEAVFAERSIETARHRTAWIEAGSDKGPLVIFLHGWPELGLVWRHQIEHFSAEASAALRQTCAAMVDRRGPIAPSLMPCALRSGAVGRQEEHLPWRG